MIFKLIATLILAASFFETAGQTPGGDSVLHRYYNKTGKSFLGKLNERKSNIDSAFLYLRKAVYLVDSANPANNPRTNESLCLLAEAYFKSGHFPEGKKIFLQVSKKMHQSGEKKKEADVWYRQAKILYGMEVQLDDIDTAFSRASRLYLESGNMHSKIDTDYDLAFFHFRLGKETLATTELQTNIKLSRDNGDYKLIYSLLLIAEVRRYAGAFNEGLAYAMEALKTAQGTRDSSNANNVYAELALEYEEMNEPVKSVYWYEQCLDERIRLHADPAGVYKTAYSMVSQMIKLNKGEEALSILQTLMKTHRPTNSLENALLSHCLACCYNSVGANENAKKYFLEMIKVFNEKVENNEELFIANFDVGSFYVSQQQYAMAEPFFKKAFYHIEGPSVSRIKDLHFLMFRVDSANGHYVSAIKHFQKYKSLNDSLFNESRSRQIAELNVQYEVEKKQQNLTILQKENTVQQQDLRQTKLIRNFILAGVGLLVLLAGLLYNRNILKQRANKQLQASQKKIEKQNVSLHRLLNEKDWLVKEIHHRVKNNLHTISGLLDAQLGYLQTDEAVTAISDSQHRVQAMSLLHQKLFNSESLSNLEMQDYIHELVGYLRHSFGTQQKIKFNLDIDKLSLTLSHALPIGLILNEAITNALKYAFRAGQEGTISIQLKQQPGDQCLLRIADNGKGLPTDFNSRQSHSMGMSLMQGLSEDINGLFAIRNNNGTEIKISFPCSITEEEALPFIHLKPMYTHE